MKRTTIFLAPVQITGLAQAAQESGLTASTLIRIAINELFARRKRAQNQEESK